GAHRRKIAESDGQRAMSDGIRRYEPPIEMNAFNLCVGGQHVERAALRLNHRGVVARTNQDPGRHGKARGNPGDERVLADVGNGAITHSASHPCGGSVRCPLCRVGRSSEPAKAAGATIFSRASGFLASEACTTRDLAARLGFTLAQTSLRKPSRAKQDLGILTCGQGWVKTR